LKSSSRATANTPNRCLSFCQDVVFVEQLVSAGFGAGLFVVAADDPLFYSGSAADRHLSTLQFSRIFPLDAVATTDLDCLIALPSRLDDGPLQKARCLCLDEAVSISGVAEANQA